MFDGLFNLTVIAEMITFIAAITLLKKQTGEWVLFRLFLFLILVAEISGWILSWKLRIFNNVWIFNILLCINACFSLWILSTPESSRKHRSGIIKLAFLFVVMTIISIFINDGWRSYNSKTEITQDIVLALLCCHLLYSMLRETEYRNLLADEYFWLANGILIFSLGSAVLSVSRPQLDQFQQSSNITLSQYLNDTLNLFLYASYIIAFICRYRNTRSLPSLS
ncbi:MAG: hypothetical protein ABWZ25_11535 [Chitinophagaceae bacterium]